MATPALADAPLPTVTSLPLQIAHELTTYTDALCSLLGEDLPQLRPALSRHLAALDAELDIDPDTGTQQFLATRFDAERRDAWAFLRLLDVVGVPLVVPDPPAGGRKDPLGPVAQLLLRHQALTCGRARSTLAVAIYEAGASNVEAGSLSPAALDTDTGTVDLPGTDRLGPATVHLAPWLPDQIIGDALEQASPDGRLLSDTAATCPDKRASTVQMALNGQLKNAGIFAIASSAAVSALGPDRSF